MPLQQRDRKWDYPELRRGVRCTPQADGLMAYQRDCVEWLFREQPEEASWEAGDPVILVPTGGGRSGRLGELVQRLDGGERWRVRFEPGGGEVEADALASTLWCPRSDFAKAVLSVCLDPGMGKTAVMATYLARLPAGTRACVLTATGLVEPTCKELTRWLRASGDETITAAATRKSWQQAMGPEGPRFVLSSYSIVRQGQGFEAAKDCFDTLLFDEAQTVWKMIGRLWPENTSKVWLRPYPQAVLSSGTPLSGSTRLTDVVDEVFRVSKSGHAASSALGMPKLTFRLAKREPPAPFVRLEYLRDAMERVAGHGKAGVGMAILWWAFHVGGSRWGQADNQAFYDQILGDTQARLRMALASDGGQLKAWRKAALDVQRGGLAFVLQQMYECGHARRPWNWREEIYSHPLDVLALDLPAPVPLDPDCSIADSPLLRHGPSAKEWKETHACIYWRERSGAWASSVLNVIQEGLRMRAGEHPPQILLSLPHASSMRRREALLEDLCNYPHRNRLCSAKEFCTSHGCRSSHDKCRFSRDGARLLQGRDRFCLLPTPNTRAGQIQELPGLGATRIYLVSPDQKAGDRSRSVESFSRDCWSGVRELRPLITQMGLHGRANRFLHVLGVADVARQLEALLVSPGLLLGLGDALDLGFNLQQRATGIALTACEYSYDKVLQLCGRIQRIPRALAPQEAGTLTVVMPCLTGTIEELILAPMLAAAAKRHSEHAAGLE